MQYPYIMPAEKYSAITPHDTNDISPPLRGFYVGVTGTVKVISIDGNTVTFLAVVPGVIHWFACTRIFDTGTDATNIIGIQ